ncbi:DMT family transporter [Oecophyllibacter saccharovorans]|uniref:DMT family transporter n=1 Tax=Oecophyllibacter saccharovorans TaxID=2558360 RepID=UPI00116992B7|nr:DMT family transporter [Oecophyllibacter saccharovorans]
MTSPASPQEQKGDGPSAGAPAVSVSSPLVAEPPAHPSSHQKEGLARYLPTLPEISLAIVTVFWGGTYYVLHLAMESSGPCFFVGVRFLIAAFFVMLMTGPSCLLGMTRREIVNGSLIGTALSVGYMLQSAGLETIPSSRSAFLTALYVPLVPLLQWLVQRKPPSLMSWVGILLAFTGLVLLAGPQKDGLHFSTGDIYTLVGTVAFAFEILFISMFAVGANSKRITIVQLVFGGLLAFACMIVTGEHLPSFHAPWVWCAVAMGLLSACVQLVMNWAQKSVPATKATMIYSTEPIWGGLIGHLMGEPLGPTTVMGAGCIVGGVVCSELRPRWPHFRRTLRGAAVQRPLRKPRRRRPSMSELLFRDDMFSRLPITHPAAALSPTVWDRPRRRAAWFSRGSAPVPQAAANAPTPRPASGGSAPVETETGSGKSGSETVPEPAENSEK